MGVRVWGVGINLQIVSYFDDFLSLPHGRPKQMVADKTSHPHYKLLLFKSTELLIKHRKV